MMYLENKEKFAKYYMVLQKLIIDRNVKRFAEIGVFKGRTIRNLLKRNSRKIIKDYIAIDPWKRLREIMPNESSLALTTKDHEWDGLYKIVCKNMVDFNQLRVMRLSSYDASLLFPDNYFDLIFIDADHIYQEVKRDIDLWLPKVKSDGVLCGHDCGGNYEGVEKAIVEKFGKIENIDLNSKWDKIGNTLKYATNSVWVKEIE